MNDTFIAYEHGLDALLAQLGKDHALYGEALTLQARLLENIDQAKRYGDNEICRSERSRIMSSLNELTLQTSGRSFNEICHWFSESASVEILTQLTELDSTDIDVLAKLFLSQGWNVPDLSAMNVRDKVRALLSMATIRGGELPQFIKVLLAYKPELAHPIWKALEAQVGSPKPVKHNLAARRLFVGRDEYKKKIKHVLLEPRGNIVVIEGISGMGKSALALEVAYDFYENRSVRFVMWYAMSTTKQLTVSKLIDELSYFLEIGYLTNLDFEEKYRQFLETIRGLPILLILDSFEVVDNKKDFLDFLQDLPASCKVIITSRHRVDVEWTTFRLWGLDLKDIIELSRAYAQDIGLPELAEATDEDLFLLHRTTGGMPIAVKWIIGQVRETGETVPNVLNRLAIQEDTMLKSIFESSWSLLFRESRQMLIAIGFFAQSAPEDALKETAGLSEKQFSRAVQQLIALNMIEVGNLVSGPRYFTAHELLRQYAALKARRSKKFSKMSRQRFNDFFTRFVAVHRSWDDYQALSQQIDNILRVIEWYYANGEWEPLIGCADSVFSYLEARGRWRDALHIQQAALGAARRLGATDKELVFLINIGRLHMHFGEYGQAKKMFEEGLQSSEQMSMQQYASYALYQLAGLYRRERDAKQARELYERSYEMAKGRADVISMARGLHGLATLLRDQHQYQRAAQVYREALKLAREAKNEKEIVRNLGGLGLTILRLGDFDNALMCFEESKQLCLSSGAQYDLAYAYHELGTAYESASKFELARDYFAAAVQLNGEMENALGSAIAMYSLAETLRKLGDTATAEQKYRAALSINKTIGDEFGIAICSLGLALIKDSQGEHETAELLMQEALILFRKVGSEPYVATVLNHLHGEHFPSREE